MDDDRDDKDQDEQRAAILARRAVFVASAIASLTAPACERRAVFGPCLEAPYDPALQTSSPTTSASSASSASPDPTVEPAPHPCLEMMPPPPPSSTPPASAAPSGSQPKPAPVPSFKPARPRPCLNVSEG